MLDHPAVLRAAVALTHRATWAPSAHSSALNWRSTKSPASSGPDAKANRRPGRNKRSQRKSLNKSSTSHLSLPPTRIWQTLLSSCHRQSWKVMTTGTRKESGRKKQNRKQNKCHNVNKFFQIKLKQPELGCSITTVEPYCQILLHTFFLILES